jgi:pyrroloquinoline quinone (PQQ) biosynthesis protein C
MKNLLTLRFIRDDFLEALASMACIESQNPDGFSAWVPALEGHHGIPRAHLGWFLEHVTADDPVQGHGGKAFEIIQTHAVDDRVQRSVRRAVRETLDSFWLMYDGLEKARNQQDKDAY